VYPIKESHGGFQEAKSTRTQGRPWIRQSDDITPVGGITRASFVKLVKPSSSAKTVPEFIAYAKANPGKINMASSGNGTSDQ
jgi:tripartite-type tricarboxylate transporter receptor subunit TctC